MQIYCPKCNVGYEIDDSLLKDRVRRLKCSYCMEIFEVGPIENAADDVSENVYDNIFAGEQTEQSFVEENKTINEFEAEKTENEVVFEKNDLNEINENVVEDNDEPQSVENIEKENEVEKISESETTDSDENNENETEEDDVEEINFEEIFERLSEQTSELIQREKKLPIWEKIWLQLKNVLGFHFKIKWSYIFIGIGLFVISSMYSNRYDVVRKVPFMNGVYKMFGIKAKIAGEGLEFQNMNWDLIKEDEEIKLQIKGFIYNKTGKKIELPSIHVEILDANASLLQTQKQKTNGEVLPPDTKAALDIEIKNPAPISKYIHVTFIDDDQ